MIDLADARIYGLKVEGETLSCDLLITSFDGYWENLQQESHGKPVCDKSPRQDRLACTSPAASHFLPDKEENPQDYRQTEQTQHD